VKKKTQRKRENRSKGKFEEEKRRKRGDKGGRGKRKLGEKRKIKGKL
jgi:hypothetical protein